LYWLHLASFEKTHGVSSNSILIKHVIEGNIEGTRIRGKRRKQLPCYSAKDKVLEF